MDTTGLFLRFEAVYDFPAVLATKPFAAFLPCPDFWQRLKEFEDSREISYKSYQKRFCALLVFLLPKNTPECKGQEIVRLFMKRACPGLPYSAYLRMRGKAQYVDLYISERRYSKKGFVWNKCYRNDFWQNPETGKMTKPGAEGSALLHRKGDLISSSIENFSRKSHIFMIGKKNFDEAMKSFKEDYLCVIDFVTGFFRNLTRIKREDFRNARNRFQVRNMSAINRKVRKIELMLEELYNALLYGHFWDDPNIRQKFYAMRNRYRQVFRNHKVKLSGTKHAASFDMNSNWKRLDETLEMIEEKAEKDFQEIVGMFA